MKKKDLIIIITGLGLLVAGWVLYLNLSSKGNQDYVEITYQNQVIYREVFTDDLKYETTIEEDGHVNHIIIENGTVRMEEANCPDQVCVGQGRINRDSFLKVIVCAPNGVTARIITASDSGLDN